MYYSKIVDGLNQSIYRIDLLTKKKQGFAKYASNLYFFVFAMRLHKEKNNYIFFSQRNCEVDMKL